MKKLLPLLLAFTLALSSCVPILSGVRQAVSRADGAELVLLTDGIGFDSGSTTAVGLIIAAIGEDLVLHQAPDGCTLEADVLDCRLGDVTGRIAIVLSGRGVDANATFRRPGSNSVYFMFVQTPRREAGAGGN